jgi:hypothetical protein
MRRSVFAVLLLCLLFAATPTFAKARPTSEPIRDESSSRFERVLREITKIFRPAPTGDYMSPPKP